MTTTPAGPVLLFVCQHGAAKSVIAAALLRRFAARHGVPLVAYAAGIEPDDALPPHVVNGLRAEEIDVAGAQPQLLTPAVMSQADYIISFGCELNAPHDVAVRQWVDVPAVSDDYTRARDDIAARVAALLDELRASA